MLTKLTRKTLKLALFFITLLSINPLSAQYSEVAKSLPELFGVRDGERAGESVAVDGNYAVIGSPYNDDDTTDAGCAYIFFYNGSNWEQQAKLTASDTASYDYFGLSVSISGDYIVIGAHGDDDGGSYSGSAYIFTKPAGGWTDTTQTAKLTASDAAYDDNFGCSVSISGDNVVIGARGDGDGNASGSAYIFTKPMGAWVNATQTAKLTASDSASYDFFGYSVSISGDNIVVGSYRDDDGGSESGSAYVFSKPAGGWTNSTQTAKLTASDAARYDRFGCSVSISGDNVVVGANEDDDGGSESGSAYIFSKPAGGWLDTTQTAKLTASDAAANDKFGGSVSISGDHIIVGAYSNTGGGYRSGSAYVFSKPTGAWMNATQTGKLTSSDGTSSYNFGRCVSISGNNVIIGAPGDDDDGNTSGSAYVYTKPVGSWVDTTQITKLLPTAKVFTVGNAFYGESVAVDGNFAVIGAPRYKSEGCAFVYFYNGSTWTQQAKLTSSYADNNDNFGHSVSISGDNVVIGAYDDDDIALTNSGAAYVFTKPAGGWVDTTETARLTASDAANYDNFGYSVSISGDNVVVGSTGDDDGGSSSGSAYIFTKPVGVWVDATQTAKLTAWGGTADDKFGESVSISGDNVVIGAYQDDDGGSNSGSAYIFTKPAGNWVNSTQTAKLTASDDISLDYFGSSVSISGDNVVIGAYGDDDGGASSGSAYVYSKPSGGWANATQTAKLTASDAATYDYFGWSVSISGNNVIVGAPYNDDNGNSSGSAYVFSKPSGGWANATQTTKLTASDAVASDQFGEAVAVSGNQMVLGAKGNYAPGSAYLFAAPPCTPTANSFNVTECISYTVPSGDETYNTPGTITINDTISNGCGADSIMTITVTILSPLTGSINDTLCYGGSITVNGTTYDSNNLTGTEVFTNIGANMCDSTVTVSLTILPELTGTYTDTVCFGGSIVVNGTTYDANNLTGNEVFTNIGANMCDSTVTVTLTVLPELTGTYTETVCFGDSVIVNGTTYNASNLTGTEVFTNIGANMCDSTVTVTLTVLSELTGTYTDTICFGESVILNGTTYDASNLTGTEVFTNIGANMCDSTVTVTLTVLPELTGTVNDTVCFGGSITVNGTTYDASNLTGTEVFTNIGANMCDSTVNVTLTILPELTGTHNETVCFGGSIIVNGTTYDASNLTGTEVFTNIGPNMCDSSVTVTLTIESEIDTTTTVTGRTVTANQSGATYRWLDCDNAVIPNETSQAFTATATGNYAVEITVANCVDTSACVYISTVGIDDAVSSLSNLKLYPNPTTGNITISNGGYMITNVSIVTITGKEVYKLNDIARKQLQISLGEFSKGVYFVRIESENQQKVIKLITQ